MGKLENLIGNTLAKFKILTIGQITGIRNRELNLDQELQQTTDTRPKCHCLFHPYQSHEASREIIAYLQYSHP